MKNILILGAGLSTASLIEYLLRHASDGKWKLTVADIDLETARGKIGNHPQGTAISLDIFNEKQTAEMISDANMVISMLPARFHPMVAAACLEAGKSMITASYVSPEMKRLDYQAKSRRLLFLNELGVDPGIDHMSAMRIIDRIHGEGGRILSFRSYTGGLIAPESDNNPWNYKFTWNPRNVVLAGQGTASFIRNGEIKYIPYHQLFRRTFKTTVANLGEFDVYANRDSLNYREFYNLPDIPTLIRGTIRRAGFCEAWDLFVQLGMTDDSYVMENSESMTRRQYINSFLKYHATDSVERKVARLFKVPEEGEIMKKLSWLGIFEERIIGLKNATPAQILQHLLEEKWKLEPDDKDMILMQHIFEYEMEGRKQQLKSSLVVVGTDQKHTAMAITVGTPVAIAAKMLMNGEIDEFGVKVPNTPNLYIPILDELETLGIRFIEEVREIRD